jgi:tetratricopeptide (TPR) repeat protein
MGAVYQAWDETLGMPVALKLIRVDASTPRAHLQDLEERFKRELKLARQVTHPNVIRIHDLGEVEGTVYLTMEYVRGSDLSTLLRRDGRLPVPRALGLARQIASGLAAAHRAGVVHRDLKPANVMVDVDDHAFLMDFGIARSTAAGTMRTRAGAIVGTLQYMAPEQARGEPADERADVYSCGLILYELLAGGPPPSTTEGELSDLIARLERGPAPLHSVVADIPADLETVVNNCLAPDAAARYTNAGELLADLEALDDEGRKRLALVRSRSSWKRLAALLAAGAALVTATWWAASKRTPPPTTVARTPVPILIVDFDNRAQDPIFDGALEHALSIAVEGAPFITAFPRRDAERLVRDLGLGAELNESAGRLIANREGIGMILAGTIERSGNGYRITVRAVQPDAQQPLAVADTTASSKGDVLAAMDRVANRIRDALGDTTPSDRQQAETFTASSLEAVQAYTVAQSLANQHKYVEAIDKYKEALQHDAEFGRAYSGIGLSLFELGRRDEADMYWQEALQRLDRMTEREKLRTLGGYAFIGRNYPKAIETFQELVAKYPSDSAGDNNLAVAYFSVLNFAKALEHGRRALQIYPKSVKYRANYALYAMYAGDFKTAAETADALIKEDASVAVAYLPLAMAALESGDTNRARAVYERAAKTGAGGASLASLGLADTAMYEGRYRDAIAATPAAADEDLRNRNTAGAVAKLVVIAEAQVALGQSAASRQAVARARSLDGGDPVLMAAAELALVDGRTNEAQKIAGALSQQLPAQSRAYGKMIEARIAMASRQYPTAIDALNAARQLADLWLVRFTLGLAYFHIGNYTDAISEFQKCRDRRGEATAVFLDDLPTFRYYAPVPYWLGRAREMQKLDPKPQYEEFLRFRGTSADPLAEDAKRRLAALH